mgnify:CR=1 FL=1
MQRSVRLQLSVMMFLQFFVWGSWKVTMGTYLNNIGFSGVSVSAAYSTMNWGAIFAPIIFIVTGQIYVDNTAPRSLRAGAQGFIYMATYGAGMLIGSWVSGWMWMPM